MDKETSARRALERYEGLAEASIVPLQGGLINQTFRVDGASDRFVLQRVNAIFDPRIHDNIEAVSACLEAHGLLTPKLVRARDGERFVTQADGQVWRLMTYIDGVGHGRVERAEQAAEAGRLVARFHVAVDELKHEFVGCRVGVHDTSKHLSVLEQACAVLGDHRLHAEVRPIAEQVLEAAASLPALPNGPDRIGHGDLKLNNILFARGAPADEPRALCLIDLDTVGPIALGHELGDAFRSWCNPAGEDAPESVRFDMAIFEAAWGGYASAMRTSRGEEAGRAAVLGVEWISLELCARFAADALNESYFGFDAERYPAAGEHNLTRARGQWALFQAARASRDARAIVVGV